MTKKNILRLAPLMIATLLLLMAVVTILIPHGAPSDYVSQSAHALNAAILL